MKPPRRFARCRPVVSACLAALALLAGAGRAAAASVTVRPGKDNTIYGNGDASLSNGAGKFLFAGSSGPTGGSRTLRSLVAFNLAGQVPAGSTINAVTLTFGADTPLRTNANTVRLHRVLADWGEAGSAAGSGEGGGAPALTGDATWNARFFNTANWTTPGGDFSTTVSASQPVSGTATVVTFTGAGLVADVQAWVNNAASNFGWILVAQDEGGPAVRLSSREGTAAPSLLIDFTPGTGGGNTAPAITTQPASQTVAAGANVTLAVVATGTPAPTYQWRKDGAVISGATAATLALSAVTAAGAGSYTVVVTNAALTVNAPPAGGGAVTARLSNLSVRTAMAAEQTLIVGVVVQGGARNILVRAAGPALAAFGLSTAMSDPRLELYNGQQLVFENNDWPANLADTFAAVGAFGMPANSRDAAFVQSIDGNRSIQVRGTAAGVVLVEAYDLGSGNSPRMINVSARNRVGTGDDILIAGFNVAGTGSKQLLIRAVGPKLGSFGVTGVLNDPKLEVFASGSTVALTENDNWTASLAATFTAVGAFPLDANSRDAALLTTLQPGSYTVQVRGTDGGTGEALVEIYEVP